MKKTDLEVLKTVDDWLGTASTLLRKTEEALVSIDYLISAATVSDLCVEVDNFQEAVRDFITILK